MAESRRMSKSELFEHFAERFGIKRAEAGEFFVELQPRRRRRSTSIRGPVGADSGTRLQVVEHLVLEPADRLGSDPDRRREEPAFA